MRTATEINISVLRAMPEPVQRMGRLFFARAMSGGVKIIVGTTATTRTVQRTHGDIISLDRSKDRSIEMGMIKGQQLVEIESRRGTGNTQVPVRGEHLTRDDVGDLVLRLDETLDDESE